MTTTATQTTPHSATETLAIRADGLYRFHEVKGRKLPVLLDISFQVRREEFVAIMGPSGSGKTTLLQLVSGLDTPSSGSIELGGRPMSELDERGRTLLRREQIGFVFQFFNLLPTLTVEENIQLPLRIAGRSIKSSQVEIERLLHQFGLSDRRDHLPSQLSGGEMQRTSIARAMITGAPILLCDEPTGNLATKAGEEVMNALRHCRDREKRTILLVTHNVRDAAYADRVFMLKDGQTVPNAELRGPGLTPDLIHETLAKLGI
ncbi:MAG: ABC transporter ATP-binding protein [Planctomycetota bacterium]